VFLSGIGEVGTGLDDGPCSWPPYAPDFDGDAGLCNNMRHGPQTLAFRAAVENNPNLWPDDERPFVVIAPQNPIVNNAYNIAELEQFFTYLVDNYSLNERRLYLTGMSQGGRSALLSIAAYPDRFAAVSVMPGIAPAVATANACDLGGQNVWAFHGENDGGAFVPQQMINFYNAFTACPEPHPNGRLTMYLNAGHNVWTRTIEPAQGMDDAVDPAYFAYDIDLYSWLMLHDKPIVDGGADVIVEADALDFSLTATAIDDDAVTYAWTQLSGPALTLTNADTAVVTVSDLVPGDYTFQIELVDADDMFDRDDVFVTVEAPLGGSTDSTGDSETGDATDTGGTAGGTGGTAGGTGGTAGGTGGTDAGTSGDDSIGTTLDGTGSGSQGTDGATGGFTSGGTAWTSPDGMDGSASASGGATDTDDPGATGDGAGCSCRSGKPDGWSWALLLGLAGFVRRRGPSGRRE
jgi:MYXO-CTERM domain-containing protein